MKYFTHHCGSNSRSCLAATLVTITLLCAGCDSSSDTPANTDPLDGDTMTDTDVTDGTDGMDVIGVTDDTEGNATESVFPGTSCPLLQGSGDSSPIAGLWDQTISYEFETDVIYLEIMSDGGVVIYDDQHDSSDQGENCFVKVGPGFVVIDLLGGNRYTNTTYDDLSIDCTTLTQEATITSDSNSLTISFVDEFDDDFDGDVTEIITRVYPRVTGVSVTDFNICTE